jgi:hypothetical protein
MKMRWRLILMALGLLLAVVLLIDFNRRMEELNRLTTNLALVHAEGTAVMQTKEGLLAQVAYATSEDAVMKWAYQNKMVRPGEHLVVPVPDGSVTETPEPPPVTQKESPPNWRIWWELFFGVN